MRRPVVPIVCVGLVVTACSSSPSAGSTPAPREALVVFAASSLTKAFTKIGADFETANPGVTVSFNFGSSGDLAGQIESEGAADVFASASGTWMDDVATKTGVADRANVATNDLVIITPASNPAGVSSIEDLGRPGVSLVLGAKGVPVGDYARQALDKAGIAQAAEQNVVSNEPDDASVVAKITGGEADAAVVYTSDVSGGAAAQVSAVPIPASLNVIATYPIAVVNGGPNPDLARRFVAYATGAQGQATLASFGFKPATGG
ncbi:MAG: molybdate ABC transporter substrate-binding protein [Actinomycetota bacterium]|nr:molybdate ABC transporter substrate-binding protein [Actinomycetota bacterium]